MGWREGGPGTPVFVYNQGQAQGAPWTALSLFAMPHLWPLEAPDSGPGGFQGAGGTGCPVRAVVVTSPRPQSGLPAA